MSSIDVEIRFEDCITTIRDVDHYRTYLRAELGKLREIDECAPVLHAADSPRHLRDLASSPEDLADALATQDRVDAYVASLRNADLIELTGDLSRLRNNGVAKQLSPHQTVTFIDVLVADILLCPAEQTLRAAFERHGWRLEAVSRDPKVLRAPAYHEHQSGDSVEFPICLAKPEPGESGVFRLIDGVHRAIQLVRNDQPSIPLCVIDEPR